MPGLWACDKIQSSTLLQQEIAMNPDTITETLQKGFHTTLGAAASFVESVQDSNKWDENMRKLTTDFDQLQVEWEAKGAVTEQEARGFVDTFLAQQGINTSNDSYKTVDTTASAPAPDMTSDIQDLTTQVAELRAELERLQSEKNQ